MLEAILDDVAKQCTPEGGHYQALRRAPPTQSHQSNVGAEKGEQTVQGLIRTRVSALQGTARESGGAFTICHGSPWLLWMVRHAAWVINRFRVHSETRMTGYEKVTGQRPWDNRET